MNSRLAAAVLLVGLPVTGLILWHINSAPEPAPVDIDPTHSTAPAELDENKQQYIWDLEHATFEFEKRIGKPFTAALQTRQVEELLSFFRNGFEARLPTGKPDVTKLPVQVSEQTWQTTPGQTRSVASDAFVRRLADRATAFKHLRNSRLRVLKITAEADDTSTGRWDLAVLLTMSGTGRDGRHLYFEQRSNVVCEFTNAVKLDTVSVFTEWTVKTEHLRHSPTLMEEITATAGLDALQIHDNWSPDAQPRQYTSRIACDDFDRDGFPDIAVVTNDGQALLLRSDGQIFSDVTTELGLPRVIESQDSPWLVTWIDFDNDGFSDLLLGPHLYHNRNGRLFLRMSPDAGLQLKYSPMGCCVADYDCDGLLDVYVVYQHPRPDSQLPATNERVGWVGDDTSGARNQLWKNLGKGRFRDVTETAQVGGGTRHSFAAAWLQANDDHYPDLYVANDFAQNSFFLNRGDGTFEDASISSGTADFATSMGVTSGDIDNDGTPEIYVANMYSKMGRRIIAHVSDADYSEPIYPQLQGSCAGNRMYRRSHNEDTWSEISEQMGINAVGWAYAPVFTDFDADGFLDIYATAGFLSFDRDEPDG